MLLVAPAVRVATAEQVGAVASMALPALPANLANLVLPGSRASALVREGRAVAEVTVAMGVTVAGVVTVAGEVTVAMVATVATVVGLSARRNRERAPAVGGPRAFAATVRQRYGVTHGAS